ncbi:MAG TPA: hypothetical protein VFD32_08420, partial [Dehalococcoidia bacterium]|nr:hypothetical protein [Dehalococcoidia bacterium]
MIADSAASPRHEPLSAARPDDRAAHAGDPGGAERNGIWHRALRDDTGLLTIFQAAVATGVSPATLRRI